MPAARLRRWLHRGETAVGLVLGGASAIQGMAYLPPLAPGDPTPTLSVFTDVFPLSVYAVLWLAVLPMSVVAIWVRKLWMPTVVTVASLCVSRAIIGLLSWLVDGADRGWQGALLYGVWAFLIASLVGFATIAERLAALFETYIRGR
jgi:hypothetical protein